MFYFVRWQEFFGIHSSWIGHGKSYFSDSPVMLCLSWSILMSLNVIFSNVWGIILNEWKGVSRKTIIVLIYRYGNTDILLLLPSL